MIGRHQLCEIDDARERFDLPLVRRWLATTYWWGESATPKAIERAFDRSAMWVGAYREGEQVGCCRVVSDLSRFAWLADVFVDPAHRGQGLAKAMVRFVLEHPECQTITRFLLVTRDAHPIYRELGFAALPDPESFMQLRRQRHEPG